MGASPSCPSCEASPSCCEGGGATVAVPVASEANLTWEDAPPVAPWEDHADMNSETSAAAFDMSTCELQVDSVVLCGLSLRQSLRTFGMLWMVPPETRYPCRALAAPVSKFDVFVSHTWNTPGRWKVLSLMYQTGWQISLVLQTMVASTLFVLGVCGVLPLPSTTTFAGIPPEQYAASPWIRTTSLPAAIIGLCVAPYIGDLFNKQVAFIDMASIDQTDAEQKKQGIYSIAEFLRMSGELQVLWSADYLSRLWCVFELAAYRTANPSGKISLSPLFVERGFAVLMLAVYGFTSVFVLAEARVLTSGSETWVFGFALVPVSLSVHALRKSFLAKHRLLTALASFQLGKSTCSSEFDTRFILRCIGRWYGGEEQFENFVRGRLRQELITQITNTRFRPGYFLVAIVPSVCAGLDSLVSLWRGEAPTAALVTHFLCLVLAFDMCWVLITFRVVLVLSDAYAEPCAGRAIDYAVSFLIFAASGVVFMAGLLGSRLARNTLSVSVALAWLAASCILMSLTSQRVCQVLAGLFRRRSRPGS